MKVLNLVRFVIAAALITWLGAEVTRQQGFSTPFNEEGLASIQKMVDDYASEGRARIQKYRLHVETAMEERFDKLFAQLDADANGLISREEFKTLSFKTLAAAAAPDVEVPQLDQLQLDVKHFVAQLTWASMIQLIITAQFTFLVFLYLIEHLRALVLPHKSVFKMKNYQTNIPPHAGKDEALAYDTPLNWKEKLKIAFFIGTGLFVLRAVLAFVFFFICVFCINMTVFRGRNRDRNPHWFSFWNFCAQFWSHLFLASFGFYRIGIEGKPATREEVKVIIGNHVCMMELVNCYINHQFPAFVSRVENLSVPGFAGLVRTSKAILVDRSAADSRQKTVDDIRRYAVAQDPKAPQVMIFPEGTCSNGRVLFSFKRGAFDPGAPVQMVCTKFPYKHFNICWNGRYCGGCDATDLLLRLMCQFVNRIEVCYSPVYKPTPEEVENPLQYANHASQMIANILGIATSDAKHEDYAEAAKKYRLRQKLQAPSAPTTPRPGNSPVGKEEEKKKR